MKLLSVLDSFAFKLISQKLSMLETTIKVSNELKEALKENKKEGETYNEMIISMYLRLKDQGWREFEGRF